MSEERDKLGTTLLRQKRERKTETREERAVFDKWVEDVRELYGMMRAWLAPFVADFLTIEQGEVWIVEGQCGYHAPYLRVISSSRYFLEIVPKARRVINADGRVDMVSRNGRAMIVKLADKGWNLVWPVEGKEGEWESANFTEDTFYETMTALLDENKTKASSNPTPDTTTP